MQPRTKALLFDVQHAAMGITRFVEGKTAEDYAQDLMLRSACERQFEIIGEAMTRMRKEDPETVERISEYHRIIGFRNVLIHGYDQVNNETTWKIITEKLPVLVREVGALMSEAP